MNNQKKSTVLGSASKTRANPSKSSNLKVEDAERMSEVKRLKEDLARLSARLGSEDLGKALDQLSLEAVLKARKEVKEDNRAIDMLEEIGRGEDPLKK